MQPSVCCPGRGTPSAGARAQPGRRGACPGGSGGWRLEGLAERERMGALVEVGVLLLVSNYIFKLTQK